MAVANNILFSAREAELVVQSARDDDANVHTLGMMVCLMKLGLQAPAARRLSREIFHNEHTLGTQQGLDEGFTLIMQGLFERGYYELYDLDDDLEANEKIRSLEEDILHGAVSLDFAQHYLNEFVIVFRSFLIRVAHDYQERPDIMGEELLQSLVLIIRDESGDQHCSLDAAKAIQGLQVFLGRRAKFAAWVREQGATL